MSHKRKAAEFFMDIALNDKIQNTTSSAGAEASRSSRADILKQARQKQLMEAVVNDTSKRSRANDYQSKAYAQWTRPDAVNAGHSYRFEEKYSSFGNTDHKEPRKRSASCNDGTNYFDRQEKRHNDAIFSNSRRNELPSDSDDDDSSGDDEKQHDHEGEKIPISSFSNEIRPVVFNLKKESKGGSSPEGDDESQPLYKRIKKNDRVMAKYFVNDQYYPALVKTVIHAGYSSAQYDIVFDFYNSVQTVSWTDIREILKDSTDVNSSGGSTSSTGVGPPPPPPPPPAATQSKVVDVSELSKPQTMMYNTVAGVPIKTVRYDSATGKAVINEALASVATAASTAVLSGGSNVLSSKISDIVSRINSSVSSAAAVSQSVGNGPPTAQRVSRFGSRDTVPVSGAPLPALPALPSATVPSGPVAVIDNMPHSIASVVGLVSSVPLVNPKLAQRTKGSWKLAKNEKTKD